MSFQVIQPIKKIQIILYNCERRNKELPPDFDLSRMHPSNDLLSAPNSNDPSALRLVDESLNVASLGNSEAHHCGLSTAVDEGLDGDIVDLAVDVKHVCSGKEFWVELLGVGSVFRDVSSVDVLFCLSVSLDIHGVDFKSSLDFKVLLFFFLPFHRLVLDLLGQFGKVSLQSLLDSNTSVRIVSCDLSNKFRIAL